ncbi:hypothetical protein [Novosphingobium gossypii]|uniref:hypothetical protein n=1 Tax=Novosphingobium gossypii TaxID=1604774 RepID=UPI003D252359
MPLPRLEDMDRILDRITTDALGDTIRYRPAGEPAYGTLSADVNYVDGELPFDGGQVIAQDVTVSVLMVDVPAKPGRGVRLQLPKVTARTFHPINVRRDRMGTSWMFELKDVNSNA